MGITHIQKKFEFFEHTADIGLIGYGMTKREAVANTACGMFAIITQPQDVTPIECVKIEVEGYDELEVLVRFLSELLYHFNIHRMIFNKFEIITFTDSSITAKAYGEKYIPEKHVIHREIKTVTYHQLKIEHIDNIWRIQVIFDV
jgi:SHS2 domain-containing protein